MLVKGMRTKLIWILLGAFFLALAWACLFTGSVDIPLEDTWRVLTGGEASRSTYKHIILELRIPLTVTAICTGSALSVAGLMLQTVFNNPLAGPSVLGVSTGASLGVAVMTLALPGVLPVQASAILGALVGAGLIIMLLLGFSTFVRSAMMLLIVGIMLNYLTSSVISLMNFYATQEGVHSYVIWGLGNFSGVGSGDLLNYTLIILATLGLTVFMVKPLNALLLGERYASNVGVDVRRSRCSILVLSGILIGVTTAYCGPIGFIGLAVPHIARLLFRTSNHIRLLPAVVVTGAVTGLLTLWLTTVPGSRGMLPVNAITPVIGVPVVIYIIINRRKLSYFN